MTIQAKSNTHTHEEIVGRLSESAWQRLIFAGVREFVRESGKTEWKIKCGEKQQAYCGDGQNLESLSVHCRRAGLWWLRE